ncbi:glycosyltransferase family 2 protein [Arthrobacter sp. MDT3-44]
MTEQVGARAPKARRPRIEASTDADRAVVPPVSIRASGPVLPAARVAMRNTRPGTFVPALSRRDSWIVRAFTALWAGAFVSFWSWWLQPDHRVGWLGLVLNSILLFYFSYLPTYFLVLVNRLRRIDPAVAVPPLRTAFLVTKAPSEPWEVARKTLEAMLHQQFPHRYDVWLCDEAPTAEVRTWCASHGVRISTRDGVEEYHRAEWPRRTKCKEGNVAYFYDMWGYRNYDAVVQLDCDHVPAPGYLAEMIRPFADPAVGYVAAPSVNDSNAATSWSARGRLHREATFHGPVQLGHADGLAPSCIGSHYAVRTRALQEIGGIGPELAEDFSTSFLLTSAGWRSAFADGAEAHGEGPLTFSAMVTQEFQWARSLMTLLIDTVPGHLRRLPWPLRARFLFALSYYPLLTLATIAGLALPIVAAVTGEPWVDVDYLEFLVRWMAMNLCMLGLVYFLRSRGMLRPVVVPLVSWENWIYAFARWPFIAWGVGAAILQKIQPRQIVFRVTPKTSQGLTGIPRRLIAPYCAVAATLSTGALVGQATTNAFGYVFLCLLGAISYSVVALAVPALHAVEAARAGAMGILTAVRETAGGALVLAGLTSALTVVAIAGFPAYVMEWL